MMSADGYCCWLHNIKEELFIWGLIANILISSFMSLFWAEHQALAAQYMADVKSWTWFFALDGPSLLFALTNIHSGWKRTGPMEWWKSTWTSPSQRIFENSPIEYLTILPKNIWQSYQKHLKNTSKNIWISFDMTREELKSQLKPKKKVGNIFHMKPDCEVEQSLSETSLSKDVHFTLPVWLI